jgi:hypothetical protein
LLTHRNISYGFDIVCISWVVFVWSMY